MAVLQARENRRAILRRIRERVKGRLLDQPQGLFYDELRGEHQGRALRVRVSTRVPFLRTRYPVSAELELQNAPDIQLRIRREKGMAAVAKALEWVSDVQVSGGDAFDLRYLVEAPEEAARAPLASQEVRAAVHTLLTRWDLEEVAIRDGKLRVHGDSRRMGRLLLHELLSGLEVLAHAYDRRPSLVAGISERFLWVGGPDQAPRCPYCHAQVQDGSDLVSCEGCRTLLHEECHQENGGCPILGCGGRGFQRAGPITV